MKRAAIAVLLFMCMSAPVKAADLQPVKITGYCIQGRTASGIETREGICAYRREDIGKIARVYDADMNLIGEFEIEDTGGKKIKKGEAVDIWKPTKAECYKLTQTGYIEVVEKEEVEQ